MSTNPPSDLSAAGKALWSDIAGKYELRPDELATLHGAARAADMVAMLSSAWTDEGKPLYTKGSMGQLVEHPTPKAIRTWQSSMDVAMARLDLPDLDEGIATNQNRDAAQSSWKPGVRSRGA